MEANDGGGRPRRGACLSILLTGGAVSLLMLLLVLATGGWAVYLIGIGGGIALFGLIHYAVWGQWMLRQPAGEREEEEVRQWAEERPWGDNGSDHARPHP